MVETLKRLEDAGSHNPRLRTGEQDLLDDRDVERSGDLGIRPFSSQYA